MNIKSFLIILLTSSTLFSFGPASAAIIGTYNIEDNAFADQLVSGDGMAYNGTDWYFGTGSDWQVYNSGWQPSLAPTDITDTNISTYLSATPDTVNLSLSLGFSGTNVVNGSGADMAFFFLWDQSANAANVTINGVTNSLNFQNVYNDQNIQQVVNGVQWNGATQSNVLLMVGEVDLANFGLSGGAIMHGPVNIDLTVNGSNPMAFSLAGAMNTQVIPLPAPFLLLLSGLTALGLISRRKK